MKIRSIALIAVLLVCSIFSTGCTQPSGGSGTSIVPQETQPLVNGTSGTANQTITSTSELIAFVKTARDYARSNGKEKALAAFNDPHGQFVRGDVYIFAEAYDGTALAEPFEPDLVGTNIMNMTDRFGLPIVRNLGETARYGIGYVSYDYPNPAWYSTVEPKLSVVADADGTYYVGAGMYSGTGMVFPSVVLGTSPKTMTEDDLRAFVKNATRYVKANGEEKAFAAFGDPSGPFVQGEMTIFAYDYNGTNLAANPYSRDLKGNRLNLIHYHDPDAVETIREMRDLARQGGGISYTVAKVSSGGKEYYVPKIDYVEPVNDTVWLFSGIINPDYAGIAKGNMTGIVIRNHTKIELYDLVNRTVEYAKVNGKEKTLAAINDPDGPLVQGDLSVWAETSDGIVLADPYWKEGIGVNAMNYTDPYGAKTTQVALNSLANGNGFVHEMFPLTAQNGTRADPKLVYMKPVDDTWWIGSGIYGVEVA
ncbi:MAG: cache domain-containing protein [Methanoregulaceae archaeon]